MFTSHLKPCADVWYKCMRCVGLGGGGGGCRSYALKTLSEYVSTVGSFLLRPLATGAFIPTYCNVCTGLSLNQLHILACNQCPLPPPHISVVYKPLIFCLVCIFNLGEQKKFLSKASWLFISMKYLICLPSTIGYVFPYLSSSQQLSQADSCPV